ncbi:hypothetical protein SDC9_205363 [bioreactor metagenome]|uniref:Uncharacterized protein n=1 Tax=bioreactor metagenome TaxID=1076179 RepID=A0A645J4P5_9ZZZZ
MRVEEGARIVSLARAPREDVEDESEGAERRIVRGTDDVETEETEEEETVEEFSENTSAQEDSAEE